jgi:PEP-CTERM motif
MRRKDLLWFLLIGLLCLNYPSGAHAINIPLTPTYNMGSAGDAVTGDNYISGQGWWVTPGADQYENDFIRERPLSTNTYHNYNDGSNNYWVQLGTYYSYTDIVSGTWGFDSNYLYFKTTLYGNWEQTLGSIGGGLTTNYGVFGSGTQYRIILGQLPNGEANYSILLDAEGSKKETWTGPLGDFYSDGNIAYWDSTGDVGRTGIMNTNEGTLGGYDAKIIDNQAYLLSRITPVEALQSSAYPYPYVEIAFNYALWNSNADSSLPLVNPSAITLLVFEANRGVKGESNYLWNDEWTRVEEGSPYNELGITQFNNVDEVDRLLWSPTPIPEPTTLFLLGSGLIGLAGYGRKKLFKK